MAIELHEEIAQAISRQPCTKPEDLYSVPARRVIGRLLKDFLVKNKLTAVELMHRPEMLKRLEMNGTHLQYVIQQTAIVRKAKEKRPLAEIIRELNKLADDFFEHVKDDKRADLFPPLSTDKFDAFAAKIANKPRAEYILIGTLARHLREVFTWIGKADRLIKVLDLSRPDLPSRHLVASAVDDVFAELLLVAPAVMELLEPQQTFGDAVKALVHLFLGKADSPLYAKSCVLPQLAWHFSLRSLPLSREAVASQIVNQIYSLQKLRNDSLDNELRAFRELTDLIMGGLDEALREEDVLPALELRAKRFVSSESLTIGLSGSVLPSGKLDWLLFAEDCIVGERNKQVLAENAIRIATADSFKTEFQLTSMALPKRLQRLAALSAAVQKSGLHENDRRKLAATFDSVAYALARDAKLFEIIESRPSSPAEKALALLQLYEDRTFTDGRLSAKVRDTVIGYISAPGFLESYAERISGNAERAVAELTRRARAIGLTPENVRELIAA